MVLLATMALLVVATMLAGCAPKPPEEAPTADPSAPATDAMPATPAALYLDLAEEVSKALGRGPIGRRYEWRTDAGTPILLVPAGRETGMAYRGGGPEEMQARSDAYFAALEAREAHEREMAHVPGEDQKHFPPGWREMRRREAAARQREERRNPA